MQNAAAPGRPPGGFHITSRDGVTCMLSDQRDHILTSEQLTELIAALQAELERAR